jgi:hypothetical protein
MIHVRLTLALVLASGVLTASVAQAQAPAPAEAAAAAAAGAGAGKKKKVIRLDAMTVEGRIQKPQAFYILQRSTLNFDELNRAETFLPKVEKTLEKDAF